MKNVVLILFLLIYSKSFFGQTLVRYGNHIISRDEFLTAFRKNNANTKATVKAYRDYLDLYIRYRLKVQAAFASKLDTLPGQISELQNFKNQIADQYTNDEGSLNSMAAEAFNRSQLDIRLSYIYVTCSKNTIPADTLKAFQKIQEAYAALKAKKDFESVAIQYSADPDVKNNRGDIGFVTVFDLPYTMETVAYNTPVGKYSNAFRTDGGYMIVKKTVQRNGVGRIHIAQILLIFPYQANDAAKADTKRRADSIYLALQAGADFGELAKKFSGDNLSYQTGGILPEFGIGKYESGFEEAAFKLKKDGDLSAPFASEFGYHIIKRISKKPVALVADQKVLETFKERVKTDPRVAVSRKHMLQNILIQTKFKAFINPDQPFWDYTDSLLQNKKPSARTGINDQSPLFQFSGKLFRVGDWIAYRKSIRSNLSLVNGRTPAAIFDTYRQTAAFEYYRNHLEEYNKTFAGQVAEFQDGNLLFDIMQRQVWEKAAADSNGLEKYFSSHTQNYWWKPGKEAIVFSAGNRETGEKLQKLLESDITHWRTTIDHFSGAGIQVDSGRFEQKQLPGNLLPMKVGTFTEFQIHKDQSVQFAYIIREYVNSSPRSFDQARGLGINDYQNELENEWIAELKKIYLVQVDEAVFKTLPHGDEK